MPIDVTMPDGTVIQGVPDNITQSELTSRYAKMQQTSAPAAPSFGPMADTVASDPIARDMPLPIMNRRNPVTTRNAVDMTPVLNNGQGATAGQQGDYVKGAAETTPGWLLGVPGNIEALGRLPLALAGLASAKTALPTSSEVTNGIFGEPQNDFEAGGRRFGDFAGAVASPYLISKGAQALGNAAGFVGKHGFGLMTQAGPRPLEEAYAAGQQGGSAGQAFAANIAGDVPATDVVASAKDALESMRADRSAAYRAGIGTTIKGDPTVLDMQPIHDAILKSLDVGTFKGVTTSESAQKVRDAIKSVLTDWQSLDPAEYHTAEGLDALKQKIGDLAYEGNLSDAAKPGSPGAKVLGAAYNAIKKQITAQAPGYGEVMKDYHDATDELRNVESALSLGSKANLDTSLRKLQSLMRDNVNTNYGARTAMGQTLVDNGATDLMPALAGQSLKSWLPRGLGRAVAGGEIGYAALGHPGMIPALMATLAASSPRLVGETAYGLGKLSNAVQPLVSGGNASILSIPSIAANPALRAMILQSLMAPAATSPAKLSP